MNKQFSILLRISLLFIIFPIVLLSNIYGNEKEIKSSQLLTRTVGEPQIHVSSADFGTISLNSPPSFKTFQILNRGDFDLTIFGYKGPTLSVFLTPDLPPVDSTYHFKNNVNLIIKPNVPTTFTIEFNPNTTGIFRDSIVFFNDATVTDSVCYINGRYLSPSLTVTSCDWGAKRIDRPGSFPIPAYDHPANQNQAFHLSNTGDQDVYINDYQVVSDLNNNGAAFEFDRNGIKFGFNLTGGADTVIPVKFHPQAVGDYKLVIKFINTSNNTTVSTLNGKGILPQIQTYDIDFGNSFIGDTAKKITKYLIFKNLNYQYQDSVKITDFIVSPDGAINADLSAYGSSGFQFDKKALNLPVWLQPGDSLSLTANFVAKQKGPVTAEISSVSDAQADVTSIWLANGLTDVTINQSGIPDYIELQQNNPNPFSQFTTIRFGIPIQTTVSLIIINSLGQTVKTLINNEIDAGYHDLSFDSNELSSGIFFYRLQVGGVVETKQMILLK